MIDDADDSAQQRNQARTRLWDYIVALDDLIRNTGPENQPPRFAEAIAAKERWTDDPVRKLWRSLMRALQAWFRPFLLDMYLSPQAGLDATAPLSLSLSILHALRLRWRVDYVTQGGHREFCIQRGTCVIIDSRYQETDDRIEIPAPIVEPAQHEDLAWCMSRLILLNDWLYRSDQGAPSGMFAAPPAIEGPPLRVAGGEDEATETDPEPAVVLGESNLVNSLIDAELPTPAKLVEFMIGRDKATFEEVMLAVYGQPVGRKPRERRAQEGKLRKVIVRANQFLTAEVSKISYRFASGHILKKVSVE